MVSTTLVSIIAAICTAAGALLATLATALYNHYIDTRKRQREERDVVGRYRDALLHACEELHTPLRFLCEGRVPDKIDTTVPDAKNAQASYEYCYLIYLMGRLFCWTYIIQNDIHNVHYSPTEQDHKIMNILYNITLVLADGDTVKMDARTDMQRIPPFQVFKGFQAAIGEQMAVKIGEHYSCMGYAVFWNHWTSSAFQDSSLIKEAPFRVWFIQVEDGVKDLKGYFGLLPDWTISRIKTVQHRLVELSEVLDPYNRRVHRHKRIRAGGGPAVAAPLLDVTAHGPWNNLLPPTPGIVRRETGGPMDLEYKEVRQLLSTLEEGEYQGHQGTTAAEGRARSPAKRPRPRDRRSI